MRTRIVAAIVCAAFVVTVPLAASAGAGARDWRTTLHYKWQGFHNYGSTPMTLEGDGTFSIQEGGDGTWVMDRPGHSLVLTFTSGCAPVYTGALHGMEARGTMRCRRFTGKWFIDRLRPARG
jgi:hypothetical protein